MTTSGSDWQSFDPSSGSLPPSISVPPGDDGGGGGILAVIADDSLEHDWGALATLQLARSWAEAGARVMLADLGLAHPSLHRVLNVENGEGMSDVFLYGVSIQRVALSVDEGSFYFAPAGTVVADPGAVKNHPRWEALEKGFDSARAVLLVYLPSVEEGREALLDRASGVILLGPEDMSAGSALGDAADKVLAFLGPEDDTGEMEEDLDFRVTDVPGGGPPPVGGFGAMPSTAAEGGTDGSNPAEEEARLDPAPSGGSPDEGEEGASYATAASEEGEGTAALEGSPLAEAPRVEPDPEVPVEPGAGEADAPPEEAAPPPKAPGTPVAGKGGRPGTPEKARLSPILLILLILLLALAGLYAAVWFGLLELPPGLEIPGLPTPG